MKTETFLEHVQREQEPDPSWPAPLRALWFAEKQDWGQAHLICQQGDTPDDAWVHACLHREEGDIPNARYWYKRAVKPQHTGTIDTERHEIIDDILLRYAP